MWTTDLRHNTSKGVTLHKWRGNETQVPGRHCTSEGVTLHKVRGNAGRKANAGAVLGVLNVLKLKNVSIKNVNAVVLFFQRNLVDVHFSNTSQRGSRAINSD